MLHFWSDHMKQKQKCNLFFQKKKNISLLRGTEITLKYSSIHDDKSNSIVKLFGQQTGLILLELWRHW